jgi:Helix-turn-helix domain
MHNDDDNNDQPFGLWRAVDVASWAKVSRSWVYDKARGGELPCIKIGGHLRFEPAAIKKFFLANGNVAVERKVIPLKRSR